ncbi:serine hydrolase family protein [Bosea caraganae]|uniref:Serine hydrolase family protein n=1 Tax=Bosea caraganae TaxID=2763117 RepID=A0A370LCN3_9HYPH|nr:alpha/beta fold hydrolase [Bosea caraganae]RDJ27711.1 serine hydrolase family protein [Bosea caraganae]RDJ29724.1 serine hydrolase family protein [Bosea caraganae]
MTILVVPGLHGSEPAHWQSRWEAERDDIERLQQADWDAPELETWVSALRGHVERRPGAVLVGHSLGATLIAHLATRHPELDIGGALLVAPADPELRISRVRGIASFGPLPAEPFNFPAILVASRSDPYMAQDRARIIANLWEAAFVDAGDAGHINVASGHGAWPEGLRLLDQILVRQRSFTRPTRAPERPRQSAATRH